MRIFYLLLGVIIAGILDRVFGVPVWQLVKPVIDLLSYQWSIVIGLAFFIIVLLLIIDGARRFHERTVSDLKANYKTGAERIRRLSEILGHVNDLDAQLDEGKEVSLKMLKSYAGMIQTGLYDCYGHSGVSKFTRGNAETIEPPQSDVERHSWLYFMQRRLMDLIDEDIPKSNDIDKRTSDAAYKVPPA